MRRSRFGLLAVTIAVFMTVTVPCAAGLMPAPERCAMADCGDRVTLSAPRAACCCAPAAAQESPGSVPLLLSKELSGQAVAGIDLQPSGRGATFETRELSISPPSPVPLFILHSAILS